MSILISICEFDPAIRPRSRTESADSGHSTAQCTPASQLASQPARRNRLWLTHTTCVRLFAFSGEIPIPVRFGSVQIWVQVHHCLCVHPLPARDQVQAPDTMTFYFRLPARACVRRPAVSCTPALRCAGLRQEVQMGAFLSRLFLSRFLSPPIPRPSSSVPCRPSRVHRRSAAAATDTEADSDGRTTMRGANCGIKY